MMTAGIIFGLLVLVFGGAQLILIVLMLAFQLIGWAVASIFNLFCLLLTLIFKRQFKSAMRKYA